ncbi:Protein SHORT-ROOT [Linum grandiflorum]
MWALNELASPYGDTQQKLASYFLHAIFSRIANSGRRSLLTLSSASDRTSSFDSTRKLLLRFQEASPWSSFGHVSSNGAILESLGAHPKLHVLDFSNTFCTQWPTFLESLATRFDDTPHLRLTSVLVSGGPGERLMNEISARMEKFARLMGVPFQFDVIHHSGDLSELNFDGLGIRDDEALAINCIGSLRSVSRLRRDYLFSRFRKLRPRIVTLVEEEADLDVEGDGAGFVKGFEECLRWFGVYFECLDESFPKTSNERLVLERRAGRAILDLVACSPEESTERREMAERWSARLRGSGFLGVELSEEVSDDVKALLRRYKEGWSLRQTGSGGGMLLCWKEQPVVWASAWRPIED